MTRTAPTQTSAPDRRRDTEAWHRELLLRAIDGVFPLSVLDALLDRVEQRT